MNAGTELFPVTEICKKSIPMTRTGKKSYTSNVTVVSKTAKYPSTKTMVSNLTFHACHFIFTRCTKCAKDISGV